MCCLMAGLLEIKRSYCLTEADLNLTAGAMDAGLFYNKILLNSRINL
jgi:hypothetical protein